VCELLRICNYFCGKDRSYGIAAAILDASVFHFRENGNVVISGERIGQAGRVLFHAPNGGRKLRGYNAELHYRRPPAAPLGHNEEAVE
jgi:hypothetical protein